MVVVAAARVQILQNMPDGTSHCFHHPGHHTDPSNDCGKCPCSSCTEPSLGPQPRGPPASPRQRAACGQRRDPSARPGDGRSCGRLGAEHHTAPSPSSHAVSPSEGGVRRAQFFAVVVAATAAPLSQSQASVAPESKNLCCRGSIHAALGVCARMLRGGARICSPRPSCCKPTSRLPRGQRVASRETRGAFGEGGSSRRWRPVVTRAEGDGADATGP